MSLARLTAATLIALATNAATCAVAAPGDQGLAIAKEAAALLQQGKAIDAIDRYTAALADPGLSNDRRAAFLADRGVAYGRLDKPREALADFNQSIRLAPENAVAYNNRGTVLLALGNGGEAEKDFNRALTLAPGFTAALVNRASARITTGDRTAALADFSQAVRLQPKAPAAYGGRGRLHLLADRPHAAVRDFNRAVGNDARYTPGYRMRAEAHVLLGRLDEALEDLSRAIAFDATNAELYLARGYAYLGARNPAAAIKDFQKVATLTPKASAPFDGLALAQARLGAHDDALDTLSKALELEPRSARAYAYRAIVYKLMGQIDLAQRDLERALRLDQDLPEVSWAQGEIQESANQREEAIASLRRALAGRPHLREAAAALERLGAVEPRDTEMPQLGKDRWQVFASKGRYYATSAEHPRLSVPLETVSEGTQPKILEFEVKGGAHAGLAILRFLAGELAGPAGPEPVEHGAVLDLQTRTVLAVETMRQGDRRATWTWGEDRLTVADVDGFKQDYAFKGRQVPEAIAEKPAETQRVAKARPRPSQPDWVPWGQTWGGGGGGSRRQPKSLFEMIFGN